MLTIRSVEKSDNTSLYVLIREVFEEFNAPKQGTVYSDPTTENLYELFQQDKSVLWVALLDEEVLGCCGVFPTDGLPGGCAELVKFYLRKEFRGRGIGKALIEKSIHSATELGYTKLYLESLPDFATAVQMYKKLGFVQLDQAVGCSGHCSCNVWMIKSLLE